MIVTHLAPSADSHDARLRGIDDRAEFVHREHPQVRDGERAPLELHFASTAIRSMSQGSKSGLAFNLPPYASSVMVVSLG
jgi:hypothetical protein